MHGAMYIQFTHFACDDLDKRVVDSVIITKSEV